jgi:hypothetical protein
MQMVSSLRPSRSSLDPSPFNKIRTLCMYGIPGLPLCWPSSLPQLSFYSTFTDEVECNSHFPAGTAWLTVMQYKVFPVQVKYNSTRNIKSAYLYYSSSCQELGSDSCIQLYRWTHCINGAKLEVSPVKKMDWIFTIARWSKARIIKDHSWSCKWCTHHYNHLVTISVHLCIIIVSDGWELFSFFH